MQKLDIDTKRIERASDVLSRFLESEYYKVLKEEIFDKAAEDAAYRWDGDTLPLQSITWLHSQIQQIIDRKSML